MSYPFDDVETDVCSVMVPITIISAMISSTTITAEDPNAAWAAGTTYAKGNRVSSATTHRVYESLKDSNTGNDPTVAANRTNVQGVGTWWADAGPTNKYAMFDGVVSTQSAGNSPLTVVLRPGHFNSLALFGIEADSLAITVKDAPGGTVIYSITDSLEGTAPPDYYEHFFTGFKPETKFIATGIDPYNSAEITVTLTKGSGQAKLGMLALGDMAPLGLPLRGATIEPTDYSSITTDTYGNTTIVKRVNATGISISVKCPLADVNSAVDNLQSVLGVPAVLIGSTADMYQSLTGYGLISAKVVHDGTEDATINITLRGMI